MQRITDQWYFGIENVTQLVAIRQREFHRFPINEHRIPISRGNFISKKPVPSSPSNEKSDRFVVYSPEYQLLPCLEYLSGKDT